MVVTLDARFDAHCITGHSHLREGRVGQDRAYAGPIGDDTILAIVSDGCSSASGNSEIGAEAMIRSCRSALGTGTTYQFDADFKQRLRACFEAEIAGKSIDDYFATMVAVLVSPRSIEFFSVGDGAWLLRHADGTLTLTQISWWRNRPFYLAYQAEASLRLFGSALRCMAAGCADQSDCPNKWV